MNLYNKFKIQTYNIGIISKDIESLLMNGIKSGDITWLKHNYKDRFFADPFMIKQDEDYFYILVEEYLFWEEKGKITLLKVNRDDFSLKERKVVIEESTHLSFPYCELGGNTVIPESYNSGKTIEYILDIDSFTVREKRTVLEAGLIDAVFFEDKDGQKWILTAKEQKPKEDMYMYHFDNGKYDPVNNGGVVFSSIKETRSAGRLFEVNGKLYRPVQDSTGRYGRQTRIVEVGRLDSEKYSAKCVQIVNSDENPPYNETLHTFNVYDSGIIVDGSKDYCRFPMKIFYKKFRWLFKEPF
jgi:hypothetical protein